jgi:hypothetical protein
MEKSMRISFLGMAFFMTAILALAVTVIHIYRKQTFETKGSNLIVVMLRTSDTEGMREVFEGRESTLLGRWSVQGVTFKNCLTSSPWYPSMAASLLTGLYPSEHGLHRSHAYLTQEGHTLAEKLREGSFRTFAAVETHSLLHATNVLQGFQVLEIVDPKETVPALLEFHRNLPPYRNYFAFLELDLDVFGGPKLAGKVLDILYDGLGREAYLEHGVLALVAPPLAEALSDPSSDNFDGRVSVTLRGKPLRIGPGKQVLKNVSLCDLSTLFRGLTLGEGFSIRDGERVGKPAVFEAAWDGMPQTMGEVNQPPPRFYRVIRFDDEAGQYFVSPDGAVKALDADGKPRVLNEGKMSGFLNRHDRFVRNLCTLPDVAIPQAAGPVLTPEWIDRLGAAWNRPEFKGKHLHAVEHVRMAEFLHDSGYSALAVGELGRALSIDKDYGFAAFTMAEVYASIDAKGARRFYKEFLDKYANHREHGARLEAAEKFLSSPPE